MIIHISRVDGRFLVDVPGWPGFRRLGGIERSLDEALGSLVLRHPERFGITVQTDCLDCGVKPCEFHVPGCDIEICAACGGQRIGCGCKTRGHKRVRWMGENPSAVAARRYGFWCKFVDGWVTCDADDPESTEDINRVLMQLQWYYKDPANFAYLNREDFPR